MLTLKEEMSSLIVKLKDFPITISSNSSVKTNKWREKIVEGWIKIIKNGIVTSIGWEQ